jgi:predicted  nucleic acid-binding Zn-ribbon protein
MAVVHETTDKTCKGCGDKMYGIGSYRLRQLCESCGGNTTEYHAENPIPNGTSDKLRQKAAA